MKKNLFTRITAAAVAAAAMAALTSCGRNEAPPMASKDNIYTTTELPITEKFEYISSMAYGDGQIYVIGNVNTTPEPAEGEESVAEGYFYTSDVIMSIMDEQGNPVNNVTIASNEDNQTGSTYANVQKMCTSENGDIALLMSEYNYNYESGTNEEKFYIKRFDKTGKELGEVDISSIKKESNQEYFYVGNMETDKDGNIYLTGDNSIYVTAPDGKFLFKLGGEEATDNSGSYINGINKTADGRVVAIVNTYTMDNENYSNKNTAKVIDIASKSYSEEYELNPNYYSYYNGGGEYDLYVSTSNTLSGYDLETGTVTTVLDWLKCGLDTTTMQNTYVLTDGRVLCTTYKYESSGNGYSWSGDDMIINILSKVDPATIPDKQLVSVYAYYLDYRTKQQIVEFNQSSELYQIEVTCYDEFNDGTGESTGMTRLTNDLVSGKIPDIIIIDPYAMPVDSYISKGILADINEFINSDSSINRDDYLTNVFDAYSVDGKLYQLVPSFNVQTLVGRTDKLEGRTSWTMSEYLEFAKAHPEAKFPEMTKESFLSQFISYGINSYIDPVTGTCSFNSADFKSLLEAANDYPEEIDYDNLYMDENYWNDMQAAYRNGTNLISNEYFYQFSNIRELEKGKFDGEVTFIGFPVSSGNGSVITASNSFAITSKAKNPQGAWEFVKYFLSDEYQNEVSGSFPLKTSAYDKLMELAKEKPFYMDENDQKVEYENTYWIGNSSIEIGVNDDADNQKMFDFIKSVNSVFSYDTELMKIISEEAAAYFAGQKSVDEVADIIQNRASTYISESR